MESKFTFIEELDFAFFDQFVGTRGSGTEGKHSPGKYAKFPGKNNLYIFERIIEDDTMRMFQEVRLKVEKLLVERTRSARRTHSNIQPITSKLLFLGENDAEAIPYLVFFCPSRTRKSVRHFLHSSQVKDLCESTAQTLPRLKVKVFRHLPQMKLAHYEGNSGCNSASAAEGIDFRAVPVLSANKSRRSARDGKRKATTGEALYSGRTAAQSTEHWENSAGNSHEDVCTDQSSNGDDDDESQAQGSGAAEAIVSRLNNVALDLHRQQTIGCCASVISVVPQNGSRRGRSVKGQKVDRFGSKASPGVQNTGFRGFNAKSIQNPRSTSLRSSITGTYPPFVKPGLIHRRLVRRGGSPSDFYAKNWDAVLLTKQDSVENLSSYVECKRKIDAAADGIDLFLQDAEDSIPGCKVDEVREFCRGVCLDDLLSGVGTLAQRPGAGAWLDDRSCIPCMKMECEREYKNPLDAARLYEFLKQQRIGNTEAHDADRRLIYIAGLDPYYILALAETASFHEVLVLRDAIWRHIARQTSLRVRIPSRGIALYQLEFHLPYFALRTSPPMESAQLSMRCSNTFSQCTDLSFLRLQTPQSQDAKKYVMLEAHISFVICGSDDDRWVAYAFDDTEFDGEDLADKISPCEGFHPDPFSSDGEVDANFPIWNPREYFVMILEKRIGQAFKEWEGLVRAVERSIREYREQHPSTLSNIYGTARGRGEEVQQAFDWTQKTIELLRRLRETLSGTITFWERFNGPNGDMGYFVDNDLAEPSQDRINLSLCAINDTFKTMEDLERTLDLMNESCRDYADALQLRMTHEGSEAAKSNGATSDFSLFVLGPILFAAALFQLPRSMLPLAPSPQSFVILAIAIMVVMKLLHVISSALPGFTWWWKTILAVMKMLKLEGMGDPLWLGACLRLVRRRNTLDVDVEMGPVQV